MIYVGGQNNLTGAISGVARGRGLPNIGLSVFKNEPSVNLKLARARAQSLGFDFSNNLTPKYCYVRSKNIAKTSPPTAFKGAKNPRASLSVYE